MLTYRYPEVYVEEKESRAKPIEVAGTSTATFIGLTKNGYANEPFLIGRFREYE